ncbi:hypothetical protein AB0N62_40795 [Streptomyces sp. NPDC093982]|uniref:hypothetical protein n=1 Tax=Streptomyces sp. NPDC093982 TaxID=3155077 RepID=UPI00342ADD06
MAADRSALRALLDTAVAPLSDLTHTVLSQAFERLGMPAIPDDAGSKRVRVEQSLQQVPDTEHRLLAEGVLQQQDAFDPSANVTAQP